MRNFLLLTAVSTLLTSVSQAQTIISGSGYTQNFNAIGSGLPTDWTVRTGATTTALGTTESLTTAATSWGDTAATFKNFAASTSLTSSASVATQSGSADRALGIRQGASFGDPGASFNFNFSTAGVQVASISIDLMMLSVQGRSTTWSIQYGIGTTPASWTTIGTYTDPGTFGATNFTITNGTFGTNLDNQANAWFRVVTTDATTGSNNRDSFGIDNFSIAVVPEPTGAALVGLTALSTLWVRRRNKKA